MTVALTTVKLHIDPAEPIGYAVNDAVREAIDRAEPARWTVFHVEHVDPGPLRYVLMDLDLGGWPRIVYPRALTAAGRMIEPIRVPSAHVFASNFAALRHLRIAAQSSCPRILHRLLHGSKGAPQEHLHLVALDTDPVMDLPTGALACLMVLPSA